MFGSLELNERIRFGTKKYIHIFYESPCICMHVLGPKNKYLPKDGIPLPPGGKCPVNTQTGCPINMEWTDIYVPRLNLQ